MSLKIISIMDDVINSCFICKNPPKTKEHIIPRWLQSHFNLENQKLGLWNNTTLFYKQALIPLCQDCNGNVLGRLEQRIQDGSASNNDYYIWALKIRFFLSLKDTTLQLDIKDPSKGQLISSEAAFIGHEYVRHALLNFERPDFIFKPNPFGSIFLFDNPFKDEEFGFIDVPHPYWGISISLPKNKILTALLTDRGLVKKEIEKNFKTKGGLKGYIKKFTVSSTNELVRTLMLNLLFSQYQIKNIPYGASLTENSIISEALPKSVNYRKRFKREVLIHLSQTLGLDARIGIEFYNSLPDSLKG